MFYPNKNVSYNNNNKEISLCGEKEEHGNYF